MTLETNQSNLIIDKEMDDAATYRLLPVHEGMWWDTRKIVGYVKIDPEDYEKFRDRNIYLNRRGFPIFKKGDKIFPLHRMVMNPQPHELVDHIYHDRLDVRKKSLRIVNTQENAVNRKLNRNNTSGYKNVQWHKPSKKWFGVVTHLGKPHLTPKYDDIEDANKAASNLRAKLGHLDVGYIPEIVEVPIPARNRKPSSSSSGYYGISWSNTRKKWRCYLDYKGRRFELGYYNSIEEALLILNNKKQELGILL